MIYHLLDNQVEKFNTNFLVNIFKFKRKNKKQTNTVARFRNLVLMRENLFPSGIDLEYCTPSFCWGPCCSSFFSFCAVFCLFLVFVLCLWIAPSIFSNVSLVSLSSFRVLYHMLSVSLDCPFLIALSIFSNCFLLYTFTIIVFGKHMTFVVHSRCLSTWNKIYDIKTVYL